MLLRIARPMAFLLIFSFLFLDFSTQPAWAALVGTEAAVTAVRQQDNRDRVVDFLGRDEVRQALMDQGVDPREAMARVASLSDAELARLAGALDRMPAGGDFGAVLGAALLVFFVLLVTDILGLTHVYSFVNR